MPQSLLRLIRKCAEYLPQNRFTELPRGLRGIYVLYQKRSSRRRKAAHYDVVYIGMAWAGRRGGIRSRLRSHRRTKGRLWSHFSVFDVWDNIRDCRPHRSLHYSRRFWSESPPHEAEPHPRA